MSATEINWKKNTALFISGQALSFFGTMIVQYAIFWHIMLKSMSGSVMTLFALFGVLPMCFISPFAGVWADRYNRKYIINIADGSIALFSLAVAILLIFGIDSYVILFVCALVRSLGQGVQTPAVGAFIPQIVPAEHLTKVNGIQGSINSFIALTTPMISAALMTFAPLYSLFFLDVVTAVIGITIVLFFVKIPANRQAANNTSARKKGAYFSELKGGIKYIRNHGYVLRMIVISALFCFLAAPAGFLTPLQVARKFGEDVWRLSALEIAFSGGMMAGGILIGAWGGLKNRVHTMALSCALCGLLTVGLGWSPLFWLYLSVMALVGLSLPFYNTTAMVLLQTTVEPAFMGRVLSIFSMTTTSLMPLGMLLFGPLADVVSIDILLMITGLFVSLLCIPMMTSKTLRAAGVSHLKP